MQVDPAIGVTALDRLTSGLEQAADAPLVEYRGRWHDGKAILSRAGSFARQLRAAGLAEGDLALIVVSDNLAAMQMLLGCWMLGAAGCQIDFRTSPARLEEIRQRLAPRLLVATRRTAGLDLLLSDTAPEEAPPTVSRDPDRIADYIATSGSTGLPKLTPTTQGRLGRRIATLIENGERGAWGTAVSALSVAYPASRGIWLRNLAAGRPIIALDLVHRLAELDAALRRPEVEECTLPPAVIRALAALDGPSPRYPHLKKLQAVGGPATPADKIAAVERLSPTFAMTYSSTECGVISRIEGEEVLRRPASCGRPMLPVSIRLGETDCPTGEVGEVVVTASEGAEVRPGDLGRLDADGYLYITGRVQGLLCRRGVNFCAERLQDAAMNLPEVEDAAVVALPDEDGGDAVHLFVQASPVDEPALTRAILDRLPIAERPDGLHLRRSLPRGPSGKVDLPTLRLLLSRQKPPA